MCAVSAYCIRNGIQSFKGMETDSDTRWQWWVVFANFVIVYIVVRFGDAGHHTAALAEMLIS